MPVTSGVREIQIVFSRFISRRHCGQLLLDVLSLDWLLLCVSVPCAVFLPVFMALQSCD
jgi:hypothetical protein